MDFVVRAISPYLEAPSVDKHQFEETECKKRVIKLTARGSDFGRARAYHSLSIRYSRVHLSRRTLCLSFRPFPEKRESKSTVSTVEYIASRKERARAIRSRRPRAFRSWWAANGRNCRSRNGVCSAGSPSSDSLSSSLTAINYRSVESFLGACERARQVVDVRERCKGP